MIACNEGQAKLRTCSYQIVSFVEESKEVREIFCNLQGDSAKVVAGAFQDDSDCSCVFSLDEEVIFDGPGDSYYNDEKDMYELTEGEAYRILDTDGDEILVLNNLGDQEWYPVDDFLSCEE